MGEDTSKKSKQIPRTSLLAIIKLLLRYGNKGNPFLKKHFIVSVILLARFHRNRNFFNFKFLQKLNCFNFNLQLVYIQKYQKLMFGNKGNLFQNQSTFKRLYKLFL